MDSDREVLEEIESYARHCRALVHDLDDILHDRQMVQQGWTLHYAVDFAEIHSYVLPAASLTFSPFVGGWTRGNDQLQEYLTLSRFFADRQLILLQPYLLELDAFTRRLVSRTIAATLGQIADLHPLLQRGLESEEGVAMKRLAAETARRRLDPDEIDRVLTFFERNGIYAAAFAHGGAWNALQRLQTLLSRRRFITMENATAITEIDVDQDRIGDVFARLLSRRGRDHWNTFL